MLLSCRMNKTLEYALKSALHQGGNDTLNIYLLDPSPYLGYTYYPTILSDPSSAILDGELIHPQTLPGGSFTDYNLGGTIVHETGAWQNLVLCPADTQAKASVAKVTAPLN